MTLAADVQMIKRTHVINNFRAVDSDILYAGALVGIALPGHASAGYILPYAPAQYLMPIGFAMDAAVTGDASASPVPEQSVDIGGGIVALTVTGIANDVTDIGKRVFPLTDNTFALVESAAYQIMIGIVVGNRSSTEVDVLVCPMCSIAAIWEAEEIPTPTPTPTPTA